MAISNNKPGFIPKDGNPEEKGFLGMHWPVSIFTYYSWARLFGYWAQAGQTPAVDWIDKNIVKNKGTQGFRGSKEATKYWGYLEALAFTTVAMVSFFAEKRHFKANIYDAVAAECGTDPDDTNLFSMYKSKNPFVRSLRDRFTTQQVTRFPATLAFAKNVVVGVFAITFNYTLERSIFIENNAYDLLQNMIYEVQRLKVSGTRDVERLYTGLERAVQRTLRDNRRKPLTPEELTANRKVFERLTMDILNETFHVKEAVYVLGEMANHPANTEHLLSDISQIEEIGLKGFARQKARLLNNKPMMQSLTDNTKRSFVERAEKSSVIQHGIA